MRFVKITLITVTVVLILAFFVGWIFKDYDSEKCRTIYRESSSPKPKSLEVRLQEAKDCSHFRVFVPAYLPPSTHIDSDHTWWFMGGLHGEVIYSIDRNKDDTSLTSPVVIVRQNSISFLGRMFSPQAPIRKGEPTNDNKLILSDGSNAWLWHEVINKYETATLLLYLEKQGTSILLTVLDPYKLGETDTQAREEMKKIAESLM